MGRKYLIEISCRNVKDNSYEDISVGFIIEPVHQDNKRKDTHDEVQTIKPPLTHYISVVITLNPCKGEMPDSPKAANSIDVLKRLIRERRQSVP